MEKIKKNPIDLNGTKEHWIGLKSPLNQFPKYSIKLFHKLSDLI